MHRVVIAVDGSDYSFYALEYGRDLLRRYEDAQVYIVHVVPVYNLFIGSGIYEPNLTATHELQQAYEERGESILDRAEHLFDGTDIAVETVLTEGPIASEITRIAKEVGADLLVLGSRGMGEVQSLLLGSVSHQVIHSVSCPVLLVKRENKAGQKAKGSSETSVDTE